MFREPPLPFEPPILELARLRARPVRAGDAPGILALYGDRGTTLFLARPELNELAEAEAVVAKALDGYANGTSLQLSIEARADGAFLGMCLLFNFHEASRRAEIGYSVLRTQWGRGYAGEAVGGLVAHAFGTLGLNRIEADIDPRNAASARLLQRLGFRHEGHLRERWMVRGEVSDTDFYGLLQSDWLAAGSASGLVLSRTQSGGTT